MELFKETNINFLGHRALTLGLSLLLIAATFASLAARGGPKYGIDFRGGVNVYVKFPGEPPVERIRQALEGRLGGEVNVQRLGQDEVIIATELKSDQELELARGQIEATLREQFGAATGGAAPFTIRQVEKVGPKAGSDLQKQAVRATLFALAGMLVYIAVRFELVAGVAAVLAIIHDTIITIGFFSFFDREINLNVIAALLTLIGYSMNDKIVVFDRVRENMKLMRRASLYDLVNRSINQTLSRTMLTAGPTLLTTVALYVLGGPVLESIAFALFVGIIVGTYSSIFVASAILVAWHERAGRRKPAVGAAAPAAAGVQRAPVKSVK